MDVDILIDELTKLKTFNPAQFKKRLYELKASDIAAFNEVVKILNVKEEELESIIQKSPKKIRVKKAKKDNSFILAVFGSLIAGFLIIAITVVFILPMLPTLSSTDFTASEAIIVGYELFNTIQDDYLQL